MQAEGGGLAFIEANLSEEDNSSGRPKHGLLAFINGYHEYVIFDPFDNQELVEQCVSVRRSSVAEETGALSSTQSSITSGFTSEYLFYRQIWIQNSYGALVSFSRRCFAEILGYASLYGELPEFDLKKNQRVASEAVIVPSERPWETIFSGSSHNLPPLTKLCGAFLESLLEKRPASVEQS